MESRLEGKNPIISPGAACAARKLPEAVPHGAQVAIQRSSTTFGKKDEPPLQDSVTALITWPSHSLAHTDRLRVQRQTGNSAMPTPCKSAAAQRWYYDAGGERHPPIAVRLRQIAGRPWPKRIRPSAPALRHCLPQPVRRRPWRASARDGPRETGSVAKAP